MADTGTSRHKRVSPKCLDILSWRSAAKEELVAFMNASTGDLKRRKRSSFAVRTHLSPVDVYCYLKGRFGEPNGFANFLRHDHSDNLIHWDFNLKAGDEDIYIYGTSRETHFVMSGKMTDEDWRDLILGIKADYKRVAKQKSAVFKSLEQWVIFPNRFAEIANVCADLHATIVDNIGGFRRCKTPSGTTKRKLREHYAALRQLIKRASILQVSCLQLSLLTPVLAEAFVNMLVLMLCKPEIRANSRQFNSFIRSQIDIKVFDLAYKCKGFIRPINQHEETFKNFKRVMDKRNHSIHGNCDPVSEQIELVYFEGKRPLFKEAGDHIGKRLEAMERQYEPDTVIKDYEDTHEFLADVVRRLEPDLASMVTRIIEDPYPGYDVERNKMGAVLPEHVAMTALQGLRYDDELEM
jgi:hypothetical protein